MSADNTILILQSQGSDGRLEFRVAHVQNAEMVDYEADPRARDEYIRSYFDKSVVHSKKNKAYQEAGRQLERVGYVEYGICLVNTKRPYPGAKKAAPAHGQLSKKKRNRRRSPAQRIGQLTARVRELEDQLRQTQEALEQARSEKADVLNGIESLVAVHR